MTSETKTPQHKEFKMQATTQNLNQFFNRRCAIILANTVSDKSEANYLLSDTIDEASSNCIDFADEKKRAELVEWLVAAQRALKDGNTLAIVSAMSEAIYIVSTCDITREAVMPQGMKLPACESTADLVANNID